MSIPIDHTVSKIIDKIYAENNGTIPKNTIKEIIDFQSYTVRQGMEDGDNVHLKYIGSFKFNHKRAFKLQQLGMQDKMSMQTEQEIVQKEGSKSWKVKEVRRIVFKRS